MKLLIISIFIFYSIMASAEVSFEIPRSKIIEIKDPETQRIYPLFIKVPKSYEAEITKRYPVVYLTDSWYSFQVVSGATRYPMGYGKMDEVILVAISYSNGSKGQSSRFRDYTPIKNNEWKSKTGEADAHIKFIENSVIPYIDSTYRTVPTKRTFIGNSLGGLFGAYILFTKPELFSSYILGSPSVWYSDNYILSLKARKPGRLTSVYISVGSLEGDMVLDAEKLGAKIAKECGGNVDLKFSVVEGARHETAFPTTAIQGLDWLYGKND